MPNILNRVTSTSDKLVSLIQTENFIGRIYSIDYENALVLTNDAFELDYSGNSKMIEVDGWVYMDGTTIIAVSPLYSE